MKIVDSSEIKTSSKGKSELKAPEKWLFSIENKKPILKTLMNMATDKAAVVEIEEFHKFGTSMKTCRSFDNTLNQVFILSQVPLVARSQLDKLFIRKTANFNLDEYTKGDKKEMKPAHAETVKAKLTELEVLK